MMGLHLADIPDMLMLAIFAMPLLVTACAILDQDNDTDNTPS